MPPEKVRVERIATGGEGVGRLADGRTVFVPRTAPGDVVHLAGIRVHRNFARARVAQIVEASRDRAAPACAHYERDRCGGCQIQHLSHDAQLRAKSAIVGDALRRIGKLDVGEVPIVANERPLGWRSRLTLAVSSHGVAGLHVEGEPHRVFALERCEIAAPALRTLWDALRPGVAALAAGVERITLREDSSGALHVAVDGRRVDIAAWTRAVLACGATLDAPRTPVFEQVDAQMGDRVRRHAVAALGDVRGRHVWDLYAGTGDTSALLAAGGATVESVESSIEAVELAESRSASDGVLRHVARVEEAISELRAPFAVVANPPRAGIDPDVLAAIAERRPERIVYVSCDPATLARDLARLAPTHRLAGVTAFDAFPQTAHVEAVASLLAT